ncbi:MAG: LuxR family two component transcriptional regulator [candidate division NC10 bacterium CSP1-5]|nr:MAG: LuxR family two component transcriptional regulator [candidate division NC10 bacterium CSP1-5]
MGSQPKYRVWYDEMSDLLQEPLTPREQEVATLVVAGLRNKEIANRLCISVETVRTHVANILAKQGILSRKDIRLGDLQPAPSLGVQAGESKP